MTKKIENAESLKTNVGNEKIKNKYYEYLKEAKSYSDLTIEAIKKSIYRYEDFTDFEDFAKFNKAKAVAFKEWLENREAPGRKKKISASTYYHYLRHLKAFFEWFVYKSNFKNKIKNDYIEYLTVSKQIKKIANSTRVIKFPSIDQAKTIINSIEIKNEIDMRDKALLSFALLTGMRDFALATIPIGCFDDKKLIVYQNPAKGVKTKFSKTITTNLFRIDDNLLKYILEWVDYLKNERKFRDSDPLFPKNNLEISKGSDMFISNTVKPEFWASGNSIRNIFKKRCKEAKEQYFYPHSFRHAALYVAIANSRNGEEIKAVSQNVGHEHVYTTMSTYARMSDEQVNNVISNMRFSRPKNTESKEVLIGKLETIVQTLKDSE